MAEDPGFDLEKANRYFAAECFNRAWDYIDKPQRTVEEEETMLQLGLASLWHWSQRQDKTDISMSVGHWQVSRIYALLGQAHESRKQGQQALQLSLDAGDYPFYQAYGYEALARAEAAAGDQEKMEGYLQKARALAERIPDPDDKKQLLQDLGTIGLD